MASWIELGLIEIDGAPPRYSVEALGQTFSLKAKKAGDYTLSVKLFGFLPVVPAEFRDLSFHARRNADEKLIFVDSGKLRQLIATKVTARDEIASWQQHLDSYALANPMVTGIDGFTIEAATLEYAGENYVLELQQPSGAVRLPLNIENDREATLAGCGRGLGETILVQEDGALLHAGLVFQRKP